MPENNLVDMTTEVVMIQCPKCGQLKARDARDQHMCVDCAKAENSRAAYQWAHQGNWMELAKESGLDPWVQQPGETQWEYSIWCAFRDQYPGRKPTYKAVAEQLGTTHNVVKKVAMRWTFTARMQAWIAETERITLAQRRQEILEMNKAHVDMARKLRDKLSKTIDMLNPSELKPSEVAQLAKLAAEMERKARLDDIDQQELLAPLLADQENPNIKKSPTKQSDLSEVVGILLQAGALGDITQIGVKQTTTTTTTTQVAIADDDGNASGITMEGR